MEQPRKREVADAYDAMGGRIYDLRYAEEQEAKYRAILEAATPQPSDQVLDLGCGTGLLHEGITSTYIGLDVSSSLLRTAYDRGGRVSKIHFACGDAESPPFRDGVFDMIFAVTLIQNTPEPGRVLSEVERLGLPSCVAVVTGLKKAFSKGDFEKLIGDAGFSSSFFLEKEELKDWIAFSTCR